MLWCDFFICRLLDAVLGDWEYIKGPFSWYRTMVLGVLDSVFFCEVACMEGFFMEVMINRMVARRVLCVVFMVVVYYKVMILFCSWKF